MASSGMARGRKSSPFGPRGWRGAGANCAVEGSAEDISASLEGASSLDFGALGCLGLA